MSTMRTKALHEAFLEEVRRARQMSPEEKLLEGSKLFRSACESARRGIRMLHPDADEATVEAILTQRLRLAEVLSNAQVQRKRVAP